MNLHLVSLKSPSNFEVKENIQTTVVGQMRSAFKMNNYKKASEAQKVLTNNSDNKDLGVEVHLFLENQPMLKMISWYSKNGIIDRCQTYK
ncbi:MAG: hypothetical protein IPP51_15980 [Bacteroidetes bacterium]|nr:hypothetical protein [Bacteroidota bacterium]